MLEIFSLSAYFASWFARARRARRALLRSPQQQKKNLHDLLFLHAATGYNDALPQKKSRTLKPRTFRC